MSQPILNPNQPHLSSLIIFISASKRLDNMAAISLSQEFASPVAAARLFKALILDSHNLIPKLMPQAIKSIEIIHGDGGEGSIKQINFAEGN